MQFDVSDIVRIALIRTNSRDGVGRDDSQDLRVIRDCHILGLDQAEATLWWTNGAPLAIPMLVDFDRRSRRQFVRLVEFVAGPAPHDSRRVFDIGDVREGFGRSCLPSDTTENACDDSRSQHEKLQG